MEDGSFTIQEMELPGVLLIQPKLRHDDRGFFAETFREEALASAGIGHRFVQGGVSFSLKDVLRGLHFQRPPHAQAKLVRCSSGEIFDVIVDHRPDSPTFGTSVSLTLSGATQSTLYIPSEYAHGFSVLSESAVVEYQMSDIYHLESAGGVRYNDPAFTIRWPTKTPVVSKQDLEWPFLSQQ